MWDLSPIRYNRNRQLAAWREDKEPRPRPRQNYSRTPPLRSLWLSRRSGERSRSRRSRCRRSSSSLLSSSRSGSRSGSSALSKVAPKLHLELLRLYLICPLPIYIRCALFVPIPTGVGFSGVLYSLLRLEPDMISTRIRSRPYSIRYFCPLLCI